MVLVLALAGCGSRTPDTQSAGPPGPSTPSAPPSTGRWVGLHDDAAGVRFSLPHHVEPESRPGQDPSITARLYQDKVDEVGLSVTIVKAGLAIPPTYPKTVYDQMVSSLTGQGATGAHLSAVAEAPVAKGRALDATLSFTATDGSRNYWRMRTITSGRVMVQLQVLTFSDPQDTDAPKRVDAMFTHLADSVTLE
jgi:hypothetical protein